jgi:hypothetical protein
MTVEIFLRNLQAVASSPYAFAAYIAVVIAWVYIIIAQSRLKHISRSIKDLPEAERKDVLMKEYSVLPKAGLSANQWLRSRKQQLVFFGFIAIVIAVTILSVIALTLRQEIIRQQTDDVTDWQMFLYMRVFIVRQDNQAVGTIVCQNGQRTEGKIDDPIPVRRGKALDLEIGIRLVIDNVFETHQNMIYPIGLSTTWTPGEVFTIDDGQDVQAWREKHTSSFARDFSHPVTVPGPNTPGQHYILIMSGATMNAGQLFYASVNTTDHANTIWRLNFNEFSKKSCFGYLEHPFLKPGNRRERVSWPILAIPVLVE